MKNTKKAIFFSIVSVLLIVLFVAMTQLVTKFKLEETKIETTRTKIKILNSLVKDMEDNYFEKIVYVVSKNAIMGLSNYYYANDYETIDKPLDIAMADVMQDGILVDSYSVGHDLTSSPEHIEYRYTVEGIIEKLDNIYSKLGLEINELTLNITPGNVEQIDPWTIRVEADIVYDFIDKEKIVSWKGLATRTVDISVIGVRAFDMPNSPAKAHNGRIIKENWIVDQDPYTEPSIYGKLSSRYPVSPDPTNGICTPEFDRNGGTCDVDTE
jgi:hypothetical protein